MTSAEARTLLNRTGRFVVVVVVVVFVWKSGGNNDSRRLEKKTSFVIYVKIMADVSSFSLHTKKESPSRMTTMQRIAIPGLSPIPDSPSFPPLRLGREMEERIQRPRNAHIIQK